LFLHHRRTDEIRAKAAQFQQLLNDNQNTCQEWCLAGILAQEGPLPCG
jgi:hypothetical protein